MRALVILLLLARTAAAWDGPGMWYRPADADDPGGGGILGTGGAHDHGIKCTDCHVERSTEVVTFTLGFAPALATTNGEATFAPGQLYTVTARLAGATLTTAGCTDMDGFAASFEDDGGAAAGALASDSGQTATSCATVNADTDPGTTALNGDCKVIFARKKANDQWTFTWRAPAAGAVHIHWGSVDGNCDMMSMKDAAVTGSTTLRAPPAAAPSIVRFALLPLIVLATL